MIYDYSDQLSLFSHDVLLPINYKNGPALLNSNITAEVQRMWITGEMMKNKTPTYEDYQNHTGLHYHRLWKATGDDWICPGCGRSKFQIMRWTLRFPKTQNAFMDWVAALHKHHDHSADYRGLDVPRFSQTLICDQCNSADGAVKKKLGLPKNFSFSPQEMRVFIKATPHEKHEIDYKRALELFQSTVIMT